MSDDFGGDFSFDGDPSDGALFGVLGAGLWMGGLLSRAYSTRPWPLGLPGNAVPSQTPLPTPDWPLVLTLAQAAAYLQIPSADLAELLTRGEIKGRQINGQWRIHRAALDAWLLA